MDQESRALLSLVDTEVNAPELEVSFDTESSRFQIVSRSEEALTLVTAKIDLDARLLPDEGSLSKASGQGAVEISEVWLTPYAPHRLDQLRYVRMEWTPDISDVPEGSRDFLPNRPNTLEWPRLDLPDSLFLPKDDGTSEKYGPIILTLEFGGLAPVTRRFQARKDKELRNVQVAEW